MFYLFSEIFYMSGKKGFLLPSFCGEKIPPELFCACACEILREPGEILPNLSLKINKKNTQEKN